MPLHKSVNVSCLLHKLKIAWEPSDHLVSGNLELLRCEVPVWNSVLVSKCASATIKSSEDHYDQPCKIFLRREYVLLRVIICFQCQLSLPDFLSLDFLRHSRSGTFRVRGGVILLKSYNSLPLTAKSCRFRANVSSAF